MLKVLETFFGCAHHHTTFPMTPVRSPKGSKAANRGTYVTCLDCGKEFSYDWAAMRIVAEEKSVNNRVIPMPVKADPPLTRVARFGGVLVGKVAIK